MAVPDRAHVVDPADVAEPALRSALDVLSLQQRAVIVLTYWQDLSPAQIADLLDTSEGTVRKQLARARARLREVL